MAFMEAQMTVKQHWYELDGPMGREWIPADLVGEIPLQEYPPGVGRIPVPMDLQDYAENRELYRQCERVKGYGVRLSAPGYMDCTPWEVYTTIKEATARYRELERENRDEEE